MRERAEESSGDSLEVNIMVSEFKSNKFLATVGNDTHVVQLVADTPANAAKKGLALFLKRRG